jgi:purine-cytosine permease-like protein
MSLKFIFIALVVCILGFLIIKKLFKMLLWVIVIVVCIVAYLMLTGKGDFKNLLKQTNDAVTNNIK